MNTISASQIDTYSDCNRFWWFTRILRLQEPPATHFTFGTVLHAVNERYLSATVNQRVPGPAGTIVADGPLKGQIGGQPVNLYPEGWETTTERDGSTATITQPEARLIHRLVEEAIESGVLRWRAGTQVERQVLAKVVEGVQLIGYIDAYKPATEVQALPLIEDHKSYGKGSLRYLKRAERSSPNYLGDNQQLKTYAWAISLLDGWDGDVTVRHNQFPKFPDRKVTAVETDITREEIVEHGEYLRDVATRMERTRKIKKWADVPGPKDTGKCARWYGKPCPFSDICGRVETPDAYQARLERLKAGSPAARLNLPLAKPKKRKTKETNVSIFDRANKQKQARSARKEKAGTAQAKAAVAEAPAINGGEPEAVVTVSGGAPWANPNCKACKGRGLTSRNTACPICDNTAKKQKRPTSMAYILETTDEGLGIAVAREEFVEALEAAGLPLEWDESEAVPQEAPQEPQAAPEPETAPEPEPEPEPQPEPAPAAPKGKERLAAARRRKPAAKDRALPLDAALAAQAVQDTAEDIRQVKQAQQAQQTRQARQTPRGPGRPSVGLTILIGATYLSGLPKGRAVITSSEVLARFGAELASDMGADSFWELDPFKRRDRLAQKADYIASSLAKHVLVHPGILGNDDEGKLVQALMGLSEGIEAVIGRVS
jgi:hypothetical protein